MERLGLVRDRPGDRLAPGGRPARADLRTDRRGHPGVRRLDLDRPEVPDHRGMDHQAFQTRRPQGPLHRPARRHDRVGPGRAPAAALRSLRPALPRETHRPLRAAAAVHRLDDACPVPSGAARRNLMNIALWIIAGFMATVFLAAGASKLLIPQEKLAKAPGGGWVLDFSAGFVKALGAVEILGAVGLILPALLDIAPGAGSAGGPRSGPDHDRRGDRGVPPSRVQARAGEPDLSRLARLRGVGALRPRVLSLADRGRLLLGAESEAPEQQRNVNVRRISTAASRCGEHFLIAPSDKRLRFPTCADTSQTATFAANRKAVMVIYGHDTQANIALFDWLRAIG